jgi:hypothetical protein
VDGSIVAKVLVIVVAAAAVYAFYLKVLLDRDFQALVRWIRTERSNEWDALSRGTRWMNAIGAVERLRRDALSDDAEFAEQYARSKRHNRRFNLSLAVGVTAIALIVGTMVAFGWSL